MQECKGPLNPFVYFCIRFGQDCSDKLRAGVAGNNKEMWIFVRPWKRAALFCIYGQSFTIWQCYLSLAWNCLSQKQVAGKLTMCLRVLEDLEVSWFEDSLSKAYWLLTCERFWIGDVLMGFITLISKNTFDRIMSNNDPWLETSYVVINFAKSISWWVEVQCMYSWWSSSVNSLENLASQISQPGYGSIANRPVNEWHCPKIQYEYNFPENVFHYNRIA